MAPRPGAALPALSRPCWQQAVPRLESGTLGGPGGPSRYGQALNGTTEVHSELEGESLGTLLWRQLALSLP